MASQPVYPFFAVKFEPSTKVAEGISVTVKVHQDIFNFLKKAYGTDELLFYLDMTNGQIASWTSSMHTAIRILSVWGAMSHPKKWLSQARMYLKKVTAKVRFKE